jgi:hypothetical protein
MTSTKGGGGGGGKERGGFKKTMCEGPEDKPGQLLGIDFINQRGGLDIRPCLTNLA